MKTKKLLSLMASNKRKLNDSLEAVEFINAVKKKKEDISQKYVNDFIEDCKRRETIGELAGNIFDKLMK